MNSASDKSKTIFEAWIRGIKKDAECAVISTNSDKWSTAREYLRSIVGRCDSILEVLDFADEEGNK